MKKFLAAALAAVMMVSLCACSSGNNQQNQNNNQQNEQKPNEQKEPAKVVILDDNFGEEQYGIGLRKGDIELAIEIQKHLDEMAADGTATEISKTWFGDDIFLKDAEPVQQYEMRDDDDSLAKIMDKGTIVIGLDDNIPPMGFRDEKSEIVGFDIDLAKEVAKRMGVQAEFQPIDWDAKEMELNTGKIDLIWNGLSINPERLEAMTFTNPYLDNRMIIMTMSDSGIADKAGLAGKKVGVQKGSSAVDAVNADEETAKTLKELVEYADNVTAIMDLKAGRIDAVVVDETMGKYIISKDQ